MKNLKKRWKQFWCRHNWMHQDIRIHPEGFVQKIIWRQICDKCHKERNTPR